MNEIYEKYPEVLAVMGIKDEKIYLDINENKTNFTEMMVIINKFTQEYLEAIAKQANQVNNKENING